MISTQISLTNASGISRLRMLGKEAQNLSLKINYKDSFELG